MFEVSDPATAILTLKVRFSHPDCLLWPLVTSGCVARFATVAIVQSGLLVIASCYCERFKVGGVGWGAKSRAYVCVCVRSQALKRMLLRSLYEMCHLEK